MGGLRERAANMGANGEHAGDAGDDANKDIRHVGYSVQGGMGEALVDKVHRQRCPTLFWGIQQDKADTGE